jgi:DNA-binding IclR family transcriptional regulator
MDASPTVLERLRYELRFRFLFDAGRAYAFPCDASGKVDLASLTAKARENYLRACAAVGRELAMPAVLRR